MLRITKKMGPGKKTWSNYERMLLWQRYVIKRVNWRRIERERSLLRVGVEREIATSATIDKIVTFVHLNCGAGRSEMPIKHNPNRDKLLKQLLQLQLFCGHSFHIIKWSFAIFIRKSAARCATTFAEKPLLKPATITATTDIEANKQSW